MCIIETKSKAELPVSQFKPETFFVRHKIAVIGLRNIAIQIRVNMEPISDFLVKVCVVQNWKVRRAAKFFSCFRSKVSNADRSRLEQTYHVDHSDQYPVFNPVV